MRRVILAGLLCASCNQILGLDQGSLGRTDGNSGGDGSDDGSAEACPQKTGCACTFKSNECASLVCQFGGDDSTGTCADPSNVAYVVANGSDNATCDQAAPCATLSAALATTKQLISIDGAIGSITDAVSINRSATIYGVHGGTLTASGSDDVLTLDSGASTVAAFDLDISGGAANGVSLTNGTLSLMRATVSNNAGVGISQTGGTLHLSRSTVASNHNGIHVDGGTFDITNNFIVLNGNGSDSLYGGMWIDDASAGSRFEFNTVVDNQIPGGAGFRSAGLLVTPVGLSSPNNILVHNAIGTDTLLANANYVSQGGSNAPLCSVGSDEGPLMFVGGGDYHITTGSVAIDHATPTPDLNTDADGNERPVGSAADQGAQEVQSD